MGVLPVQVVLGPIPTTRLANRSRLSTQRPGVFLRAKPRCFVMPQPRLSAPPPPPTLPFGHGHNIGQHACAGCRGAGGLAIDVNARLAHSMQLQLRTLALPLQPHPGLTLRLETPVVGAGTAKSGLHFVCNAHTPCTAHHLQTGECTAVDSGVVMCCERACVYTCAPGLQSQPSWQQFLAARK